MKIIREYVGGQIGTIDLQKSLKKETFLRDQTDGKIAVVTLSFLEKLSCFFQKFFCCRTEIKIKNFTIIPTSRLKALVTAAHKAIKVEEVKPQPIIKVEKPAQKELKEIEPNPKEFAFICKNVKRGEDYKPFIDELIKPEEVKSVEKKEVVPLKETQQGLVNAHAETLKLSPEKREAYCHQVSKDYVENYGYSKELIEYMKTFLDSEGHIELLREFTFLCFKIGKEADSKKFEDELFEEELKIPPAQKVHNLINKAKLDEALKEIIHAPKEEQNGLKLEVATAYVKKQGYSEIAADIVDNQPYDRREEIFKDFARICCVAGRYEAAIKYCGRESDDIFIEVANEEYGNDHLEKVVDILNHLVVRHYDNDQLRLKVGARYFEQGKLDEACDVLLRVIFKIEVRDHLLTSISKKYFKNKEFDKAAELGIYNEDFADLKNFYTRIVENYHEQGEDKKALMVLGSIQNHGKLLEYSNMLRDHLKGENPSVDEALKIVWNSPLSQQW